jgi:hypothetical protein
MKAQVPLAVIATPAPVARVEESKNAHDDNEDNDVHLKNEQSIAYDEA